MSSVGFRHIGFSYTVKIAGINGYYGISTVSYKILAVAKTIKLDKASTTLGVNESITLKATTDPAAAALPLPHKDSALSAAMLPALRSL